MKIFFDARQLLHAPTRELHNGSWMDCAERPERARGIAARLGALSPVRDWGIEPLRAVHLPDYLDFLASAHEEWRSAGREGDAIGYTWPVVGRRALALDRIDAKLGRYSYDAATPIAPATWQAAYWSAQAALSALDPVLNAEERVSFALCRPPGHHAGADYLGGYCYLNNAAIAARAAAAGGAGPVAVLDIDYHHGNGTQDIFYEDGELFYASIHADPSTDYPFFWGHADECGAVAGEGATLNLPLPRGTKVEQYLGALDMALGRIARWGARLLILSFGADIYAGDPISHFAIGRDDFPRIAQRIAALELPTVIVMEGGYAVDDLGDNVAGFLDGFEGR